MSNTLQLLDCTLRDGGQALENLNKNGIKTEIFTEENRRDIATLSSKAGIDIIEIGCMSDSYNGLEKFAIYNNIEELSKYMPKKTFENQLYTGLYVDPDTSLDKIPEYSPELVEGIRVILRYSELKKSVDYCAGLAKKGYKVFVQPMLTMRYTDDEIKYLVYEANNMNAYALYIVDSFGYMNEHDVDRLYNAYAKELDKKVKIGFHAHNNMENALINVKYVIENLNSRDTIIDACAVGMGQGAGNMQTEVIVDYLNRHLGTKYDFNCILEICEILDKFRPHDIEAWGYSPVRLIPAVHGVAYKYAIEMRLHHNMSLVEINNVLSKVPEELRHRYTPENLKKILNA